MHSKDNVVYDLQTSREGTFLKLISVETRKPLSHDDAASIEGIPDIFIPASAPGMAIARWRATGLPMKALGAMFDAGFYSREDIDRLEALREEKAKAERDRKAQAKMAELAEELLVKAERAGVFRLPTPAPVAVRTLGKIEFRARLEKARQRQAEQDLQAGAGQ